MHRSFAPDARISPHLRSLFTHQLQQRAVQEAELVCEQVRLTKTRRQTRTPLAEKTSSVFLYDTLPTVAHEEGNGAYARTALTGPNTLYALSTLMPDTQLRASLTAWLDRTADAAPHLLSQEDKAYVLPMHTHFVGLHIALWRLSTWVDSANAT